MEISLKSVPPPRFTRCEAPPVIPAAEYERRLNDLYASAEADWVVVYADREHYGNLTYLLNFDPRFEEALLILGAGNRRLLMVGNEGLGYTSVVPVAVEVVLCQTFSLCGQQRDSAPSLKAVLGQIGVKSNQAVSMIGWKYLEAFESDQPERPAFLPAFIVDVFKDVIGPGGKLVDGTALIMHPEGGLRACNSADQIALFEAAAQNSSSAVFGILRNVRPGMSEMQAVRFMNYHGAPFSIHPIFVSGKEDINGLRSPGNRIIEKGDAVSVAVGYWGSLVCRAGLATDQIVPAYFENIVKPYFKVIVTWYETMQIGIKGGEVFNAIDKAFEGSGLHSSLNPGHLTSYDEWLHSPIRSNSQEKIYSGMVFQCDIIPTPMPPGQLINCEDTVAIADENLRAQIRTRYPDLWNRIQHRRKSMREVLGIRLHEEILPLTEGTGYLPPFWLLPDLVCVASDQ